MLARLGLGAFLPLVCLVIVVAPTPASAQRYKADEVDKSLASRGAIVRRFVKSGEGDQDEFEAYFTKYYFPAMTQPTPDGLRHLGKHRNDLFKNFLYNGSGDTQKWLSDQALAYGKRVASTRGYHPAVRLNAVLIIGRIDDKYNKEQPVPSAEANDFLCRLAAAGATRKGVPHYLLSGALTGLERHTRSLAMLPAKQKSATARTLYGVLNVDQLAGEYQAGVPDWIFLQAATGIANLKTVGPRGVFAVSMGKRVADESLSLETRSELAGTLAKMKATSGNAPAEALSKAVLSLAIDISDREEKVAEKFIEFQNRRRGGQNALEADRDPVVRRRFFVNEDRQIEMIRKDLVTVLAGLQAGAKAVAAISEGETAQALATIERAISSVLQASADEDLLDWDVADAVKEMAVTIREVAEPLLEEEPAEEVAPEGEEESAETPDVSVASAE